jgi:ABC-type glycerol-3-phosphate transport system permease component
VSNSLPLYRTLLMLLVLFSFKMVWNLFIFRASLLIDVLQVSRTSSYNYLVVCILG